MGRFRTPLLLMAFLLSFVASSEVRAETIDQFTYTANGNTFVWQLPASPVIGAGDFVLGQSFTLFDVQYSENDGALVSGQFDFFNANPVGGGFDLSSASGLLVDAFGPQVYMWSEAAPTFVQGTYELNDYALAQNDFLADAVSVPGILVITIVPEPSVLLLMGAGLLILTLGFALRKAIA
jgi:hypothetical protein